MRLPFRSPSWVAALVLLALVMGRPAVAQPDEAAEIAALLAAEQAILRDAHTAPDLVLLRAFYGARGHRPAWTGMPGNDGPAAALLAALRGAREHGLESQRYNLEAVDSRRRHGSPRDLAEIDLLLTDAYLRHARDLRFGQRLIDGVDPPAFDALGLLHGQLAVGSISFAELVPQGAEYRRLRDALHRYRDLARQGGWPPIAAGPSIKPGMRDERVATLRARLAVTGEWAGDTAGLALDEPLVAALMAFQRRHGLAVDGVLGKDTLAALNVPVERRLHQIVLNLERLRWLPRPLERVHLMVNVAAAQLSVVENDRAVLAMPVVVGDPAHPTPVFRAHVTSVVANPPWRVPRSIAVREILPRLRKEPGYLADNKLTVLRGVAEPGGAAAEPAVTVSDWSPYGPSHFPFQLRQAPGPENALGQLKFNVTGSRDIYLHDTPNRASFEKPVRALSHGCIRLSRPLDLALYLLKSGDWDADKLNGLLAAGATRTLSVGGKVPLYVLYFTAWADEDGTIQFRDDLYGRDQRLDALMADPFS